MKLLLDEQVPIRLSREFPDTYHVSTVKDMGWVSVRNGKLIKLAIEYGFEAIISADKNMEFQHNPETVKIPVIILSGRDNRLPALQRLVPAVMELLVTRPGPGFHRVSEKLS